MSTKAHFSVTWRFDGTTQGTVTVDRNSGTFSVRPHRRHKAYELPLAFVAQIVAERVIKTDAAARRAEKKARRLGR